MGRPLKSDDKRRTVTLRVRLTASEKSRIEQAAANAGLTPSDLLRGAVLGNKPERRVPTPDRTLLLKLLAELNMVGSNINQIARALNRRQDSAELIGVSEHAMQSAHYGVATLTAHLIEILAK